ncbi:TNF receptor-associated factor 4-like isoform X2 [Dendronephthya gigantea]|uniref:TNF receptor-associated factor 4-like isoform X2 n=1 Tax=Dendronephthya gigantea TaxID=151771 RepID=UPI00106B91F6|nr:TNF receptor-associated factor 4-like isoform X2 [Dendronephthya gigantea]
MLSVRSWCIENNIGVYLDESSGKKIQSLTVFCRYCSQGCKWKGPLRKLKSHLSTCEHSVIECSNKCGVQLMRNQLEEHVRNLCSNRYVSCPNCRQNIPREEHEKHSRSCGKSENSSTASKLRQHIKNLGRSKHDSFNQPRSLSQDQPMRAASVPAQLNFVGRTDIPQRRIEEWHGTTGNKRHNHNRRRSRNSSFGREINIQETLQEEETAPDLPDSPPPSQTPPLRRRPEYGSQVVYMGSSNNPPPQTSTERELFTCVCGALMANEEITTHMSEECPKRLTLCQYCNKQVGHSELQEHLRDCPRFPLSCPNSCGVRQIPREEINRHVTTDCSAILEVCPFKFAGCGHKCPRSNINRHLENKMKEHLNLMCKLSVKQSKEINELQAVVKHCKPFNQGQLLWKIEKFSACLETAKEISGYEIHSPPFYTDQYGYKFMIVAFPNGNGSGEGTHLSLYVRLLVGEYDSLLKWPFLGDISLTLIEQSSDASKQRHISQNFSPDPSGRASIGLKRVPTPPVLVTHNSHPMTQFGRANTLSMTPSSYGRLLNCLKLSKLEPAVFEAAVSSRFFLDCELLGKRYCMLSPRSVDTAVVVA